MSLSEIMSRAGLHGWAEMALVIFFVVFVGIVIYVVLRRKKAWEHARHLPLDDDAGPAGAEDRRR